MVDVFSKKKRSDVMSRIHSKNTLFERKVFSYLRKNKVCFLKHYNRLPGKPDIARPKEKKIVFLDGDFWHGRDFKTRFKILPLYWKEKISRNIKRDIKNRRVLKKIGWNVLRIWEHDLQKNGEHTLHKVYLFLTK